MSSGSGPSFDRVELERAEVLRQRNESRARRRENARDVVLTGFLLGIAVSVGWGMWRLDDRSERLFSIVASSRAAGAGCP